MTTPSIDNQNASVRTNEWLAAELANLWQTHFADVAQVNPVAIRFGRASRTRLGTITGRGGSDPRHNPERSEIRINQLLADPLVPEVVVRQTIAHELCHYTHGFCSRHPQKFDHPHRGKVVERELTARGLRAVYAEAEAWLKANWPSYIRDRLMPRRRTTRRIYVQPQPTVSLLSHITGRLAGHRSARNRRPHRH